jgi:hypothetical protein
MNGKILILYQYNTSFVLSFLTMKKHLECLYSPGCPVVK